MIRQLNKADQLSRGARSQRIVACLSTREAKGVLLRARDRGLAVQFCDDEQELIRAVEQEGEAVVVWELAPGDEREIALVAAAMHKHDDPQRFLLRIDLPTTGHRQIAAVAEHLPHAFVSLRGVDDLEGGITTVLDDTAERSAIAKIARHLLPLVPERAKDIVAAAIVVGRRRTKVRDFGRLCAVPVRTIDEHLAASHVIPAEDLLGLMVALHSLWRLEVLRWSPKGAAAAAGYDSRNSWSNYFTRHAGASPPRLVREGGFAGLLARVVGEIVAGGPGG